MTFEVEQEEKRGSRIFFGKMEAWQVIYPLKGFQFQNVFSTWC
jgi:hypothetical protein